MSARNIVSPCLYLKSMSYFWSARSIRCRRFGAASTALRIMIWRGLWSLSTLHYTSVQYTSNKCHATQLRATLSRFARIVYLPKCVLSMQIKRAGHSTSRLILAQTVMCHTGVSHHLPGCSTVTRLLLLLYTFISRAIVWHRFHLRSHQFCSAT